MFVFADTFSLAYWVDGNDATKENVTLLNTGIAWSTDKNSKFNNPPHDGKPLSSGQYHRGNHSPRVSSTTGNHSPQVSTTGETTLLGSVPRGSHSPQVSTTGETTLLGSVPRGSHSPQVSTTGKPLSLRGPIYRAAVAYTLWSRAPPGIHLRCSQ